MSESYLKKEFKEKDVQRVRNIVTKKYGDKTSTQIGYTQRVEQHTEGDIWEEKGKTWTIKDGLKQTVTKLDKAKKELMMPLLCPECNKVMKSRLDKKMYPIRKKCFECVISYETELKLKGEYEAYAKNIVVNNFKTYLDEARTYIKEYMESSDETFMAENGDVEHWEGGENKKELGKKWLEDLDKVEKNLES